MCKKIHGDVNSDYYALFNLCFKEMQYSRFSSFEVMCKTRNSDFRGSVGLKLHNKAPNSDYHSAFI